MLRVVLPDERWHPRSAKSATQILDMLRPIVERAGIPREWQAVLRAIEPRDPRFEVMIELTIGWGEVAVGSTIDPWTLRDVANRVDYVRHIVRASCRRLLDGVMDANARAA